MKLPKKRKKLKKTENNFSVFLFVDAQITCALIFLVHAVEKQLNIILNLSLRLFFCLQIVFKEN